MHIAIIGGGPAGLRAAEVAAAGGADVTLFDAKPSVGRKFLVAGRGGLNLTNAEPREHFDAQYHGGGEWWTRACAAFDNEALRQWASGLGIETFAASTGRVYPRGLKAAPMLRRWVERLRASRVRFAMNHRWTGIEPGTAWRLHFQTSGGHELVEADGVVLALGGGSWPETGSDGSWTTLLAKSGVAIKPLAPANCGWESAWPPAVLAAAEGQPLKNLVARAGGDEVRGELLITRYGLEGGAIYQLGPALRGMENPTLAIDFKPAHPGEQLIAKLGTARRNYLAEAHQRWRLSAAAWAIVEAMSDPVALDSAAGLAAAVKNCTIRLTGPRPLTEAISSAGGVAWSELDQDLMIRRLPGVFVAGEMIDWEAPTGGYLIHGCFVTATRAAHGALSWLHARGPR